MLFTHNYVNAPNRIAYDTELENHQQLNLANCPRVALTEPTNQNALSGTKIISPGRKMKSAVFPRPISSTGTT